MTPGPFPALKVSRGLPFGRIEMSAEPQIFAMTRTTDAMDPTERLELQRLEDDLRRVAGIKPETRAAWVEALSLALG